MKRYIIYKISFLFCFLISFTSNIQAQNCGCGTVIGADLLTIAGDFDYPCTTNPLPFTTGMFKVCTGVNWPIQNQNNGVFGIGVSTNFQGQWGNPGPINGTNYFVGDGAYGAGNNVIAWQQTVNVVAGTTYLFSVWYMYQANPPTPTISLLIDGNSLSQSNTQNPALNWNRLCAIYTAATTGTITLAISINRPGGTHIGADFGLDDVDFSPYQVLLPNPAPDYTVCKGQSVQISANVPTNGSGNYTYTWSNGATGQTITVNPDETTNYTVTITDIGTGCMVTDKIKVTVINLEASLGEDFGICPANPNVTLAPEVTGGSGNYSYLWNTGATTSSIVANYNSPGTFTVTVTDNTYGCQVTDVITVYPAVCTGDKYYQNRTNLPVETHFNRIFAGYNVTGAPAYGYVTVLNGQSVTFKAGASISLEPGFSTDPGAFFEAFIIPGCYLGGVTIKQANDGYCAYRLTAIVGVGTGSYTYSWNTGATTQSINVSPTSSTTYSVTVTDPCLGTSVTVNTTVVPNYRGNVSYTFPNLVTPNNDGNNDRFIVADGGKTQYAFNAYEFNLDVYNKWGSAVWSLWGGVSPTSTGFKEGDIYWNPNSPYVSDGVYYASLELTNCDHFKQEITGWIEVIRSGQKISITPIDASDSSFVSSKLAENSAFKIFPNPANDQLYINTPIGSDAYSEIRIIDMYGLERKRIQYSSAQTSSGISISDLPDGLYLIEVLLPNEQKYITKFYKKAQ